MSKRNRLRGTIGLRVGANAPAAGSGQLHHEEGADVRAPTGPVASEVEAPVTYYCRRSDKDGKLECEVAFLYLDAKLYSNGIEAYLLAICAEPERDLDKAGAIRPYEYRCSRVSAAIYMLSVGEI